MRKHKKEIIFPIIFLFLVSSLVFADDINTTTTSPASHPYLDEQVNYNWFKIIGIPEPVSRKDLIIYLCLFIAVFAIVFEVVNISGIISQKWINFCIALIILLLGNYSVNVTYIAMNQINNFANIITFFTKVGWIKIVIGIALVIGFFVLLKWGLGYLRKSADKEKAEDFGGRMKTLGKVLNIEATAHGIK